MNRLKIVEENIDKIVDEGLYAPPYKNKITPFDKNYEYKDSIKIGTKKDGKFYSDKEIRSMKNKYLYLQNKKEEKEKNINNKKQPKGKPTGFASPVSASKIKNNFKVDFNHVSIDGKKYKDWSKKEKEAFWEGFSSNSFTNSKSYKSNIKIDNKTNNSKPRKMDLDNSYTGEGHCLEICFTRASFSL